MSAPATSVAVLVGSLRKESFSRKLAEILGRMAPADLSFRPVAIGDLPLYDPDLEDAVPAPWTRFRDEIRAAGAILFVTPEYNRSIPGVLKNAIDVGSRPPKANTWAGKPGAVVSLSQGPLGGFGANHHVRQSVVPLGIAMMATPEAYVGRVGSIFDDAGGLVPDSRAIFETFLAGFARWVERHPAS